MARIPATCQPYDKAVSSLEDDLKRMAAKRSGHYSIGIGDQIIVPGCVMLTPVGNYLFSGPTGVGKTEVAKQLAEALGIKLMRFDMSEYMERHTVSRLIGAPPGYVDFDRGLLTDAVDQTYILMFDEIEKPTQIYSIFCTGYGSR